MSAIYGNAVGNTAPIKTLKIVDADGNEFVGVVTDSEVLFTATDNDVREGIVYASSEGVSTGTKVIPTYHTQKGDKKISNGKEFKISFYDSLDLYDFTKLQVIICPYVDSIENSVQAEKVVIGETVYNVNSSEPISTVTKDHDNKTIKLGITNNSGKAYVLRYFTYKEIY